ncbi:MAG TPA: hypothetical protein VHM66_00440 [Solirubrobacterales bacterium]|nr:hypothetical protein [Solirubrobacterales bacterium]
MRAFNPPMRVTATARRLESQVEIADFIAGADVVIDAAYWPAHDIERWCNSACCEANIPYITMSHSRRSRGSGRCTSRQDRLLRLPGDRLPAGIPTLRRRRGVGMEVMHLLTGLSEPSTLGVAHLYDLRTMDVKREHVVPQPDCPACGHLQPAEHRREAGESG